MEAAPRVGDFAPFTVLNNTTEDYVWGQPYRSPRHSNPHKKRESFYEKPAPELYSNQSSKYAFKEAFIKLQYPLPESTNSSTPPKTNRDSTEDFTEVFLSHARVYVFAEKYDIQPLKALAIHQLHATLAIFTLYSERVGDIAALLRYSYANTAEDTDKSPRPRLFTYTLVNRPTHVTDPKEWMICKKRKKTCPGALGYTLHPAPSALPSLSISSIGPAFETATLTSPRPAPSHKLLLQSLC